MVQAAPRARSRVALLVGGRCRDSPRLAEPQPRRIEATRGQGSCPKVSGGRRAAAGRPPSLRTRPCLARRATAGSPTAATWSARVPHQQLLQQPTCRVGSQHAARAAATRRDRHAAPARDVGRRVTRQGAAVTQPRPGAGPGRRARAAAIERRARRSRGRSKSFLRVGGRRGAATAWLCPPQRPKHASGRRRGCDWARRDPGCRRPQHARGLPRARVWAAPLDWTARCGHRSPVGYARFAPPAVTPAIAVTPRNNPCVTCVTCVTRRMYVCLGGGERGPEFH